MSGEEFAFQLSIKHGPGDTCLTNVRAHTVRDLAEQMEQLHAFGPAIDRHITGFKATEALGSAFEVVELPPHTPAYEAAATYPAVAPSYEPTGRPYEPRVTPTMAAENQGPPCKVHGLPREYKSGEKGGKRWRGWFCPVPNNKCEVEWVRN